MLRNFIGSSLTYSFSPLTSNYTVFNFFFLQYCWHKYLLYPSLKLQLWKHSNHLAEQTEIVCVHSHGLFHRSTKSFHLYLLATDKNLCHCWAKPTNRLPPRAGMAQKLPPDLKEPHLFNRFVNALNFYLGDDQFVATQLSYFL